MGKIKVIERKVTFCFEIEEPRKKGDWNRNLLCSEIEEIQTDPPKFQIKREGDRFLCRQKYKLKPYSGTPYHEETCSKLEKLKEPVIDLLKIFRKISRPSLPRQVTPPMLQPPPFLKKDTTTPPSPEPKKKSPEVLPRK